MPTENRSSNTEQMVILPRDLIELALAHLPSDSTAGFELRDLLAQPAAQHQVEPEILGYSVKGNRYAIALTKGELLGMSVDYTDDALIELIDRRHLDTLEKLHGSEEGLPKEGWPVYHKRKMEALRDITAGRYERKLAERDTLLHEQSGKLIVLASRLLQEPLRVLSRDLDSEGAITRIKVTDGVERASDSLGGLAMEIRRVADALSASAEPQS